MYHIEPYGVFGIRSSYGLDLASFPTTADLENSQDRARPEHHLTCITIKLKPLTYQLSLALHRAGCRPAVEKGPCGSRSVLHQSQALGMECRQVPCAHTLFSFRTLTNCVYPGHFARVSPRPHQPIHSIEITLGSRKWSPHLEPACSPSAALRRFDWA